MSGETPIRPTSAPVSPSAAPHPTNIVRKRRYLRGPEIETIRAQVYSRDQEWREALLFTESRCQQAKEKEKEELRIHYQRQKSKILEQLNHQKQENMELHARVMELANKLDQLESRQSLSASQQQRYKTQFSDMERENRILSEELQLLKQKKNELDRQLISAEGERTTYQTLYEETLKKYRQKVLESVGPDQTTLLLLQTAQHQLEEARRNEESLQRQLEAQREMQHQNHQVTSNGAIEELHRQIEDLNLQLQQRHHSNVQIKITVSELEGVVGELRKKISTLEGEKQSLIMQLQDLQVDRAQMAQQAQLTQLQGEVDSLKTTVGTLQQQLSLSQLKLSGKQAECAELQDQLDKVVGRHKLDEGVWARQAAEFQRQLSQAASQGGETTDRLQHVQRQLKAFRQLYTKTQEDAKALQREIPWVIQETHKQLLQAIATHNGQYQVLLTKYKKEVTMKRKYFNLVQELRGNIRVFCRVRPALSQSSLAVVVHRTEDKLQLLTSQKGIQGDHRYSDFEFDRVFGPSASQEDVYADVSPLVTSAMDGYNVCIFAYGQTGSGKTYTMEGVPDQPGINERALFELFRLKEERTPEFTYTITVSMFEIYNEKIRDLLCQNPSTNPWDEKVELKIRHNRQQVFVEGLTEWAVQSANDVASALAKGRSCRSTGVTNMNEHSSRSHMLLCVKVVGVNNSIGVTYQGKLYLIDLAGSERLSRSQAEGTRLREAQAINKSLAELGNVLEALQKHNPHVPYRNSALTFLLQDSLGGQAKTLMVVNVSPLMDDSEETNCSLTFATRVRKVELGRASRQVKGDEVPPSPSARRLIASVSASTLEPMSPSKRPPLADAAKAPTTKAAPK